MSFEGVQTGALVFRQEPTGIKFALILNTYGFWTFPKGSEEPGESDEEAAKREVREELGLKHLFVRAKLGTQEYPIQTRQGPKQRLVHYFLIETTDDHLTLELTHGLVDAKWYSKDEISRLRTYKDISPLLEEAFKILRL